MVNAFAITLGLTVTASTMAAIIIFFRKMLKKRHIVSRSAFVFLWLVVFIRACIPFGIDIDYSGMDNPLPNQMVYQVISQQVTDSSVVPVNSAGVLTADVKNAENIIDSAVITENNSDYHNSFGSYILSYIRNYFKDFNVIKALAMIWFLGAFLISAFIFISYIKKAKEIKHIKGLEIPSGLETMFEEIKSDLQVSNVRLKLIDASGGAVYGIFRPTIILGKSDVDKARMILIHEMVHITRKDNLKKTFAFAIMVLHWFNPVFWISVKLMHRDIEMACDEQVLRIVGKDGRENYAGAILESAYIAGSCTLLSNFGESPVYERIKHILAISKKQIVVPVICIAALIFFSLGCFASPVYEISEHIAKNEGAISSAFYKYAISGSDEKNIVDYTIFDGSAVFILKEDNNYVFRVMGQDKEMLSEYTVDCAEKICSGAMYCDGKAAYYLAESDGGYKIKQFFIDNGVISDVIRIKNTSNTMKIFGSNNYLCWYEKDVLKVFDLNKNEIQGSYITTGNQDYGAVMNGWVAYQYYNESGTVIIRCMNLDSGKFFDTASYLRNDTYSVYGNENYIVYKQDYMKDSDVYIYFRDENKTKKLWEIIPKDYRMILSKKVWGINLLGDNMVICGDGNEIYTVDLTNGHTEELCGEYSGFGFYSLKNNGNSVTAMLYENNDSKLHETGNIYVAKVNPDE